MKKKMVIVAWVLFIFCALSCGSTMVNEVNPILRVSLAQNNEQIQSGREIDKKYVRIKNTRKVNIREKPSTNSKVIDEVSPDTIFEYLGQEGNWYQIQYDAETTAYVSAKYSVIESESGELLQDLTESGGHESQSETTQNGDGRKNTKTCIVCKGTGRCKYCVAGRMYVGGDQMGTCPFCWGSMMCYMCGGLGYTP